MLALRSWVPASCKDSGVTVAPCLPGVLNTALVGGGHLCLCQSNSGQQQEPYKEHGTQPPFLWIPGRMR